MSWALWVVLGYLLVLAGFNFVRSRQVRSQEDFMVAGRKLSLTVMVFTLVCTWIGSGSFIAGAEYAASAGWSSLWLPAGAWVGIAVIYFLAAKIRTFGQYTVGDILEVRYGRFARLFGAVALIIAFTTIVSYQFRAGGYILNIATGGAVSLEWGQFIAATFVILFTALGGMIAVAHTDLPNGIIIVLACAAALPFTIAAAGGVGAAPAELPAQHFTVFARDFGAHPVLKAGGYFLATLLLLMGVQSMYQKFYSARSPAEARRAVALWIVGTIVVETLVVAIAIYSSAQHWPEVTAFRVAGEVRTEVADGRLPPQEALGRSIQLAQEAAARGEVKPAQVAELHALLDEGFGAVTSSRDAAAAVASAKIGIDPASLVLQAAGDLIGSRGIAVLVGLLLLGAACAVVISTGMNYLLSPTTNIMRDIYQRFLNPGADQATMVALQKVFVVLVGIAAFMMIWIPTYYGMRISVLRYSYFAYTMYGVSITPALLAALTWRRATWQGGLASIVGGAGAALFLDLLLPALSPASVVDGDPWGIPSIFFSAALSIGLLFLVSLATPPPTREELAPLFPERE